MMLSIRRRHKQFSSVFSALFNFRQKRGNALLATAGLLNGIFGRDGDRHVACWQSQKVTDHFEEEGEDGTITMRDRERFTNSVTLAFRDGRTAILGDENAT